MSDPNPLLLLAGDESQLPPFTHIKPIHVEPALTKLLADSRCDIDHIVDHDQPPTWANFVQPLEETADKLDRLWAPVAHLNGVMDSEALRQAYQLCLPKLSEYATDVGQDPGLFKCFTQIANSDEYHNYTEAQRKVVDNALRDFRLAGVDLPTEKKNRFKQIQQKLSDLTNKFSQNVLDATDGWYLHITDESDLVGLPGSTIAMAAQAADEEGVEGWKFGLQAPSFVPVMTYADKAVIRQQMYEAYVTRASDKGPNANRWNNDELILEILRLRKELAAIVGFQNYAEYSLATKMANNAAEVEQFLRQLVDKSLPAAKQELQQVKQFANQQFGVVELNAWDVSYYSEKLRQSLYQFNQEEIRPYFPLQKVLDGMFDVVGKLFGIKVRTVQEVEIWHDDVAFFEITDAQRNSRGRFYVDLYARAHKRGGAWMAECISRKRINERTQLPVAFLTCNFSPPIGDKPALLTHDEVITLFHEFGHTLHHLLTQIDHVSVSGINGVAWDAVELPSQFLENWCWQREALDLISGHYQTGVPLPDDLLEKMQAAKNFQAAMQMVRQLEFSMFDLLIHRDFEPDGKAGVQEVLNGVREEVAVMMPPSFNRFQNSFSHIFAGGYAAGYYSYKWAEVLSADAFSKFEEDGVFNSDTGQAFLQSILEQGGSRDPLELFIAFRGRAPSDDALLRHSGLNS